MWKIKIVLFWLVQFPLFLNATPKDTITSSAPVKSTFLKQNIVPISLITAGALLNLGEIKYDIHDVTPSTNTNVEDYFQYAPMVQLYFYDAFNFEHKNTVWDQTKYLAISQLISSSSVQFFKRITKIERPRGGNTSFPSGHTANAFTGATVLYLEFKETEPLLAWSGYAFAVATGALRMTNDAHWLSDVLAGAGIGILTVNLIYHLEPLKNWQPFNKRNKNLTFTPLITPNALALHIRF